MEKKIKKKSNENKIIENKKESYDEKDYYLEQINKIYILTTGYINGIDYFSESSS
jgi:hypothetical protein